MKKPPSSQFIDVSHDVLFCKSWFHGLLHINQLTTGLNWFLQAFSSFFDWRFQGLLQQQWFSSMKYVHEKMLSWGALLEWVLSYFTLDGMIIFVKVWKCCCRWEQLLKYQNNFVLLSSSFRWVLSMLIKLRCRSSSYCVVIQIWFMNRTEKTTQDTLLHKPRSALRASSSFTLFTLFHVFRTNYSHFTPQSRQTPPALDETYQIKAVALWIRVVILWERSAAYLRLSPRYVVSSYSPGLMSLREHKDEHDFQSSQHELCE